MPSGFFNCFGSTKHFKDIIGAMLVQNCMSNFSPKVLEVTENVRVISLPKFPSLFDITESY